MAEETKSPQKKTPQIFVYVGPTVTEIPLKFGQILSKIPQIPQPYDAIITRDFFVPLKDYPTAKRKLAEKRKEALRKIRSLKGGE